MNEPDKMEVTVTRVEESEEGSAEDISVEVSTTVDSALVHLLAKIAARRDKKTRHRVLYNVVGVAILLLAAWFAYTYFVTKTNTTRGPAIIALMIIMAVTLLRYINTPIITFMERRMQPYLGQVWHYRFSDEGIELTLRERPALFEWSEFSGWWLEDGFYLLEVSGQAVAVRRDRLEPEEDEDLRSLLYIYLGEEQPPAPEA